MPARDRHIAIRCDSELVRLVREAAGPGGSMSEGLRTAVREYAARRGEPTVADVGIMVYSLAEALGVSDTFHGALAKRNAVEAKILEQLNGNCVPSIGQEPAV